MKTILGIGLALFGLAAGVYAGLWWAFIGGIIEVVRACQATPLDGLHLGLGVLRILFAQLIGVLSALAFVVPGVALVKSGSDA